MQDLVKFAQSLADETRLRILQLVSDEALCVCELAEILEMPQSSVSSHLQVIRKAGLLESEKCEKWVYYRLAENFQSLLATICAHFAVSADSQEKLASDLLKARQRPEKRANSCCPGPKILATVGSRCSAN